MYYSCMWYDFWYYILIMISIYKKHDWRCHCWSWRSWILHVHKNPKIILWSISTNDSITGDVCPRTLRVGYRQQPWNKCLRMQSPLSIVFPTLGWLVVNIKMSHWTGVIKKKTNPCRNAAYNGNLTQMDWRPSASSIHIKCLW